MTGRERLQERGAGISPVEGHRQGSTMPRLLRQFVALPGLSSSGHLACDLLDGSRLRRNPVYPVIPLKQLLSQHHSYFTRFANRCA